MSIEFKDNLFAPGLNQNMLLVIESDSEGPGLDFSIHGTGSRLATMTIPWKSIKQIGQWMVEQDVRLMKKLREELSKEVKE